MGDRPSRRATSWSPVRFARRSALGHRRGQTAALVAVAALITACTAFAPIYDRAMQQALVDTLLANADTDELVVKVQSEATVDARGANEAADPGELQVLVPRDVAAELGTPVPGRTASVTTVHGDIPPTGPILWREGACEHVLVLSGTCPDEAGEILVSEADVDNFDLAPGTPVRVRTAVSGETGVRLEVVGTYAPRDRTWWQGETLVGMSSVVGGTDPSAAHDAWLTVEETFLGGPVFLGETSHTAALVRTGSTDVDGVLALGDRLDELSDRLQDEDGDLTLMTALGDVTDDVREQTRQAHRTVPLLVAPLAVLSVFVLWLVLGAATEQRRGEVAVARLRGRGRAGATGVLLLELLPVLLPGVAVGAVGALLGGALARALLPGAEPFEVGVGFAVAVLLAAVAVVLTTVAAAVRVAREPLDLLVRRGRASSRRWAVGALDAFLLAVAGTGVLAFVTGSLSGPAALVGPALLALLAGLVLGHLATPAASVSGRWLLRRGRLVAGLTLLETGRRPETRTLMAVLTVASALAVFAVDALVVGERNRVNASQHEAGAPVVLRLEGLDLDGARSALEAVDPGGRRTTPVMISRRDTLAVDPEGFRQVAFFPRGAPTAEEWRAVAPPDAEPVVLTGTRFALTVRTGPGVLPVDALGQDAEAGLDLVVTAASGTRRTIPLGTLPRAGERATLVGRDGACVDGCRLVALAFTGYADVSIQGSVDLGELEVDGRRVEWPTSAEEWNTTDSEATFIAPTSAGSGALRLQLSTHGIYPAEATPAWVPLTVPTLLPTGRRDPLGLVVSGVNGADRPAESVGRVVLVPSMPRRSALVDLDAITRGQDFSASAVVEVWLDEPALVEDVVASLRERGIAVEDVRRYETIRQRYEDTVAAWSLALGAVVGPAVVLIALLVLLVLAVTGWRDRARDLAVLRLNGAGRRTTRRLAVWAQLPGVLLAIATGVAAGTVGAALAMPDVPFLPTPPEAPVVDPSTAWPAVLAVAAACFVVLPAAAALAGAATARQARADRVKDGA